MNELCETAMMARVADVLDKLPLRGGLYVLSGPDGLGKKTAIEAAAASRPHVVRHVVPPAGHKPAPRAFFADLAFTLGVECRASWSLSQAARAVVTEIGRRNATVVFDHADELTIKGLACVRYLLEMVPHLVLCGNKALLDNVMGCEPLRTQCRIYHEMAPPTLAEVQQLWGKRFSNEALAAAYESTNGNWKQLWTAVYGAAAGTEKTRELGGEQMKQICDVLLLKAA